MNPFSLTLDMGATPINFTEGDPVAQIIKHRQRNTTLQGALRARNKKMPGVMCGVDAVGYEALGIQNPSKQKPLQVLDDLTRLVNPTGAMASLACFSPCCATACC